MSTQKIKIGVLGIPARRKNNEIEFLLSQRHQPDKPLWHNKWQFIGGGMEWGETPEQTLSREFEEEIAVSCEIIWPYPIAKTSTWKAENAKIAYDSHILLLGYIVDIGKQTPSCEADKETKQVAWCSLSEAVKLDALPNFKEFLLEAEKIIKREKLI